MSNAEYRIMKGLTRDFFNRKGRKVSKCFFFFFLLMVRKNDLLLVHEALAVVPPSELNGG